MRGFKAGQTNDRYHYIPDHHHGSVIKRIAKPDDPVRQLMLGFIHSRNPHHHGRP